MNDIFFSTAIIFLVGLYPNIISSMFIYANRSSSFIKFARQRESGKMINNMLVTCEKISFADSSVEDATMWEEEIQHNLSFK